MKHARTSAISNQLVNQLFCKLSSVYAKCNRVEMRKRRQTEERKIMVTNVSNKEKNMSFNMTLVRH